MAAGYSGNVAALAGFQQSTFVPVFGSAAAPPLYALTPPPPASYHPPIRGIRPRHRGIPMAKKKRSALVDTRVIYCGDNLDQLAKLPDHCIDLIYIDPPFNSNRNYEVFWGETKEKRSFADRHASTQAYIEFMRPRCVELARVLKKTGSFYYHCDWHASHYIKVKLLDEIFGFGNFGNEIIWKRSQPKSHTSRRLSFSHDSLFWYTKSQDYTFNKAYTEYSNSYVDKFYRFVEENTGRRYQLGDCTNPNKDRPNLTYEWKGITRVWRWTKEKMAQHDKEGRLVYSSKGVPRYKRYLDEMEGQPITNIWDDIEHLHGSHGEYLGYPTQKPVTLLRRVIAMSSNEGDIVLDPFCGCGTALVAAQKLNRRWIGIDIAPSACRVMGERLERDCGLKRNRDFMIENLPISVKRLRDLPPDEFQEWCVHALSQGIPGSTSVVSPTMSGDMGIDGKLYLVDRLSLKAGAKKVKKLKKGEQVLAFDPLENYIPIQVKQKDKVGRPDIDEFYAAIKRDKRNRGFFAAFGYADTARKECERLWLEEQISIQLVTVKQLIDRDFRKELEYIRMLGGGDVGGQRDDEN